MGVTQSSPEGLLDYDVPASDFETDVTEASTREPHRFRRIALKVGAVVSSVALIGGLGYARFESRGHNTPADLQRRFRIALVTVQFGQDPGTITACVEGELAPEGSKAYASVVIILSRQSFDGLSQVSLPDMHAPRDQGADDSALVVDCSGIR